MPNDHQPRGLRRRMVDALLGAPPAPAPARPRMDAAPPNRQVMRGDGLLGRLQRRMDTLRNTATGMGNDKVQAGRPDLFRMPLAYSELSNLWRYGGHARRYVEIMPNDATRKSWSVESADGEPVDIEGEHKRLHVVSRVAEADTWGRLYGGAWILMVVDEDLTGTEWQNDPQGHLARPLDLSRVRALQNLVVLDWSEVTAAEFEASPRDPNYRQPSVYSVHPHVGGWIDKTNPLAGGARVHASRMLYFYGAKLPPQKRYANRGVDDSILQSVWDQLRNTDSLDHSLAALAAEMRITTLRMRDLSDVQVSDEAEYFDYRMKEMARHRSVLNTVLLADGEEYQHHPGTVSGMGELVGTTRQSLQAVTGMPEQLWIGNAPGGLSTDGESHRNLWANAVSGYQTVKYQPPLERLYRVMFAAKSGPWGGQAPEGWRVKFNPLDELTEKGMADLRKTVAETDVIYIDAGVLDPEHVTRSRFGPLGWQFELLPVEQDTLAPAVDTPAVLALLAKMGGDPGQLSGATPAALPGPVEDPAAAPAPAPATGADDDASLADRRRLAASMTRAKVAACEHGKKNRCQLCGVERRRALVTGEDGDPILGEDGGAQWAVQWAAIGDYASDDDGADEPSAASVLQSVGLARTDAAGVLRDLLLRGMEAQRRSRTSPDPAPPVRPRMDADDGLVSVWLGLPLPDTARGTWEALRLEAATIAGVTLDELDMRGHRPHVTLLWVGKFPAEEAASVAERVREAVDKALGQQAGEAVTEHRAIDLRGYGLGAFSPSPSSEGDTPMYLGLSSPALSALHAKLAAELLSDEERRERPWYEPHATVGYAPGSLTPEQWDQVWASRTGRGDWTAHVMELHVGGELAELWMMP